MDVYNRTLELEYQTHLCPKCGWQGIPKNTKANKDQGLYEEVYICPNDNCHTKWISMFSLIEKVVID